MKLANEPAFPVIQTGERGGLEPEHKGMTLRQYVSKGALEGLLSNAEWMKNTKGKTEKGSADEAAKMALYCADALIAGWEAK